MKFELPDLFNYVQMGGKISKDAKMIKFTHFYENIEFALINTYHAVTVPLHFSTEVCCPFYTVRNFNPLLKRDNFIAG